ncbi:transmembrane transporter [Arthrobacter sp. ZXY-2]|nr:transmembrane transporter [Arthrobacter sp. ZXY-2]
MLALRLVIGVVLAGSLFVQVWMVPLLSADLEQAGAPEAARIAFLVIVVLGILCVQVVAVCVWKLLTMVRRGTVFSNGAFKFVDIIFWAVSAAAVLVFSIAVLLAPGDVAPGVVLLICGAALMVGGVALVILVLRTLLAQAVARDVEAAGLRAELDEVI